VQRAFKQALSHVTQYDGSRRMDIEAVNSPIFFDNVLEG
jgi:hypothetical protein